MAEEHQKPQQQQQGEVNNPENKVMAESESGADPSLSNNAAADTPLSDAARIQETFSRVMQKVKSAYTKELQRKKQVDVTSSVDIMRKNIDETNDSESNEDDEAMQAMSKEIEVTRRLLEVSKLREEQSKQTIAQLEAEVSKLQKLVEEEEVLRRDEGLTLQQLIVLKKQLTIDNEKLAGENQTYSQQFILLQTELQDATVDKRRLDLRLVHLQQELLALREELEAEVKASALVRQQRDVIRHESDLREAEIAELGSELEKCQTENSALKTSQDDLEAEHQKLVQGTSALSARCDQLIRELDSAKKMLAGMDEENAQLNDQLKLTHNLIQERTKEINNLETYNKSALARIEHYERECLKADTERELLETQLDKLDKELYQVRYAATEDRQGNDKIMRENRQLHVQLHEHLIAREKQSEVWIVQQETIRRLEQLVREDDSKGSKMRLKLSEIERENIRLMIEKESVRKSFQESVDKLAAKEREYTLLVENRSILEKQILQLQSAEENASHIKSSLDYELAKIKEENYEQDKRIKTLTFMVEKLKEELSSKEALLMHGKRVRQQLERDLVTFKTNVEDLKKADNEGRTQALKQEKQLQKLQLMLQQVNNSLREAELQIQAEKNSNGNIEQRFSVQRDQLEETKIQLRDQGWKMQEQVAVTKRLETELTLLRAELEIKEQEKKALCQKVYQSNNLQRDYEHLRETLLHEQSRRSALETLKSTPVLVHPWRILQAANPTAYVTMMREQAAKRNKIKTTKGRTVLPDVAPKRLLSSFSRHGPNNELQVALIKAII
ncbi:cilia- and flagella-associated protein 58-like [Daphnia pulicaria]|uniref:cilia- and flagella-associated protein 58-like n=1 Tax=Daphnia pulicaria TaxID=35523 RepID=UPI001EEBEAA7|nr:cilia- and flagella-associated protein 58-like [Daphnia pulicaria]